MTLKIILPTKKKTLKKQEKFSDKKGKVEEESMFSVLWNLEFFQTYMFETDKRSSKLQN